jgi:hypothetical protein
MTISGETPTGRWRSAAAADMRGRGSQASTEEDESTEVLMPAKRADFGEKADDGDRTRDPQLGKLMLYQMSYGR